MFVSSSLLSLWLCGKGKRLLMQGAVTGHRWKHRGVLGQGKLCFSPVMNHLCANGGGHCRGCSLQTGTMMDEVKRRLSPHTLSTSRTSYTHRTLSHCRPHTCNKEGSKNSAHVNNIGPKHWILVHSHFHPYSLKTHTGQHQGMRVLHFLPLFSLHFS